MTPHTAAYQHGSKGSHSTRPLAREHQNTSTLPRTPVSHAGVLIVAHGGRQDTDRI